jgi:hypothetical protein
MYPRLQWVNYGLGLFIQTVLLVAALCAFLEILAAFKVITKVNL